MPTNWLGWIIGGFFFGFSFAGGQAVFHALIDSVSAAKNKGRGPA